MTSLFDISCAWVSTLRSDLASADSSFALTGRLLAGSSLPPLSIPFKRGERHSSAATGLRISGATLTFGFIFSTANVPELYLRGWCNGNIQDFHS